MCGAMLAHAWQHEQGNRRNKSGLDAGTHLLFDFICHSSFSDGCRGCSKTTVECPMAIADFFMLCQQALEVKVLYCPVNTIRVRKILIINYCPFITKI